MRLGVVLPSFSKDADDAMSVTRLTEGAGFHGAFCYDHLWPMGEPGKPAISPYPLLGALSQMTSTITLATLVSRVGLVPDDVLINELTTIHELSGGRFIASLGTGDHKSEEENLAYGAPFPHAELRRGELLRTATRLKELGLEVWIGGGGKETNDIARVCGATLNLWGASVAKVQSEANLTPVTWAGRFPQHHDEAARQLADLRDAGAAWAVYIWPGALEPLVDAANATGIALDGGR